MDVALPFIKSTALFTCPDSATKYVPVPPGGEATLVTSSLAVGTHTITAIYSGDSNYLASTSPPTTLTVGQLSTASLIATDAATMGNWQAAYGADKGWHGVARVSRKARIEAVGLRKDVAIEDGDEAVRDQVDHAYREKYGTRYASIVESITDAEHRATTLRLTPRVDT